MIIQDIPTGPEGKQANFFFVSLGGGADLRVSEELMRSLIKSLDAVQLTYEYKIGAGYVDFILKNYRSEAPSTDLGVKMKLEMLL